MPEIVQDIKDRILIEDLVSQYVQLKKMGKNYKGLCPFHNEKTPSFVVNPERQIAYCFGCHKGGDIFSFTQEIEGVDFRSSIALLAEKAGLNIASYTLDKPSISHDQRHHLLDLYEKATLFYQDKLRSTSSGQKAQEYLLKRGLTEASIAKFRLGYAPDSYEETSRFLLEQGFTKKNLVEGGMALSNETTVDKIYDRFRGRIIFPIFNNSGAVVAFGARALNPDQEPKYLNSPETSLYRKSHMLYGFFQAKSAIKKQEEVLIVEGYMDVIAAFQSGIEYVVASCGTALTDQQVRVLKPLATTLLLAFDNDKAGQDASRRAFEVSQNLDMSTKVIAIENAKDIAELTLEKKLSLTPCLSKAVFYIEHRYQQLFHSNKNLDAITKRRLIEEMAPLLQILKSTIERDEYIRRMAFDLELREVQIYDELRHFRSKKSPNSLAVAPSFPKQPPILLKDPGEVFLGLIIEHPQLLSYYVDELSEDFFIDNWKILYTAIRDKYNSAAPVARGDLIALLPFELQENAALLAFSVAEKYGDMDETAIRKEMNALLLKLKSLQRSSQRKSLLKKLWQSEKEGNNEESRKILQLLATLHQS